ncbi:MAG: hypothetical protein CR959_00055 [Fusobacteriales bacterium]|nr:MAG: hypothetical protein CR959_00055 [Fusobacteriales bacterium]
MINKNLKSIKDINKEYIEKNDKIKEFILREKLKEVLKRKLSGEIKIYLDYFKDEIIYLKVLDSTSKHFIHTNKNKILEELNLEIDFKVLDIRVKLK